MATQVRGNVDIKALSITNAEIATAAAIAYSKLNLTGAIVNADIVSLAWSKLTGTPTTLAGYGITSPLPVAQGGTGTTTAFTAGSIVFAGASGVYSQDNVNLFWDDVNNRLGIGITPTDTFHVLGTSTFQGAAQGAITLLKTGTAGIQLTSNLTGNLRFYDGSDFVMNLTAGKLRVAPGTTAATAQLEAAGVIYTTGNGAGLQVDNRTSVTAAWQIVSSSGELSFLDVASAYATRLLLTATSGLLGIGVTPTAVLHLKAGTATANTAPVKFTSGAILTAAEAGALEFLTDDYFATITTAAARKAFVLDDGARLTSGKIPVASTNGRLIDGQTPLAGTKVYWVSDSNGGAVDRKLTFIAGILTAET